MKKTKPGVYWLVLPIFLVALAGCIPADVQTPELPTPASTAGPSEQVTTQALQPATQTATPTQPVEQPITQIPLSGWPASQSAELSGLAWYGDYLILLPQYPRHATGGGDGYVYALPKAEILDFLDGKISGPLEPKPIPFDAYGLRDEMRNYQGFESIAFAGDRVYLTIESGGGARMMGFLVTGQVEPDLSRIVIDTKHLVPIAPQANLANMADEAMLLLDDRILTFYEVNGAAFNPHPVAHVFDLDMKPEGTVPSASLEYRLTDAARIPGSNRFWVIDSFFLADMELAPASDPLAEAFGKGPTHSRLPMVERLVEMEYTPAGVRLTGEAPIQLELAPLETRNWEGLALLDERGFLLVTDKYPSSMLAFVPRP